MVRATVLLVAPSASSDRIEQVEGDGRIAGLHLGDAGLGWI